MPPLLPGTSKRIITGRCTNFPKFTVVTENRVCSELVKLIDQVAVLFGGMVVTGVGIVLSAGLPVAGE